MAKQAKPNRFAPKLHIKRGDQVLVISGASKGSRGEVLEVFPKKNRAIVADTNLVTKHTKPSGDNPGGIEKVPAALHLSNLMLIDPKSGEPTRIGRRIEDGKIVRYAKKSGETIR